TRRAAAPTAGRRVLDAGGGLSPARVDGADPRDVVGAQDPLAGLARGRARVHRRPGIDRVVQSQCVPGFVGDRVLHVDPDAAGLAWRGTGQTVDRGEGQLRSAGRRRVVQLDVAVQDLPGLPDRGGSGGRNDRGAVGVVPAVVDVPATPLRAAGIAGGDDVAAGA